MFNYVQQGSTDYYAQSIRGAYQAFFDSNIQADFVSPDVRSAGKKLFGRYFLQEYDVRGGQAAGRHAKGHISAVDNHYGSGRTLLIGTIPGAGYYRHHSPEAKAFFAELLKMARVEPRLRTSNAAVQACLHSGAGGEYLWVVNPSRNAVEVTVSWRN